MSFFRWQRRKRFPRGGRWLRESYFPTSQSPGLERTGKGCKGRRRGCGAVVALEGRIYKKHSVLLAPEGDADIPPSSSLPFPLGKEEREACPASRGEGEGRRDAALPNSQAQLSAAKPGHGAILLLSQRRATEDRPWQVFGGSKLRSSTLSPASSTWREQQSSPPPAASQNETFLGCPRGKKESEKRTKIIVRHVALSLSLSLNGQVKKRREISG